MEHMAFDLILSGGWLIDGTGAPRRVADVGIRGDRVAAIGDLSASPRGTRRDVSSLIVAPGFIDTHTHDDLALLNWPEMPFKVSQGVTTVIVGQLRHQSGASAAAGDLPRPLDLLGDAYWFRFPAFACTWRRWMPDRRPSTRQPWSVIRPCAPARCPAWTGPRLRMICAHGCGAGRRASGRRSWPVQRVGVQHGRGSAHGGNARWRGSLVRTGAFMRPISAMKSDRVLEAMDEALQIARDAGVPVIFSHHKVAGRANHGRSVETLALLEQAPRTQQIGVDAYPYTAGATELSADRVAWADRVLVTFSKAIPEARGATWRTSPLRWVCPSTKRSSGCTRRAPSTSSWKSPMCGASWPGRGR